MPLQTKGAKAVSRGPRRLEHVPPFAKGVLGVEHVTTVAQLRRLKDYVDSPVQLRQPFIKLGCSVSHTSSEPDAQNSTWAVTMNGTVEVLRRNGDPRNSYKWFKNPARPWNIGRAFPAEISSPREMATLSSVTGNYVVTVAVSVISEDIMIPELKPDGQIIFSTKYRILSATEGLVEVLVNGVDGWWRNQKFDELLFSLREASGEIFANEDGALWVSLRQSVSFPHLGFADTEAMVDRRAAAPDLLSYLKTRAHHYLISRINPYGTIADKSTLTNSIDEVLADQDLCTIGLPAMDMLVKIVKLRLAKRAA